MRILIILCAALALAACKQNVVLPSVISPYRIDIQQGNVVTQEMVAKLKAGMTRSQVRFVLGSPLVTDMFHGDRWDYVYLMQKQGKPDERRRLTVIFDGDKLVTLEGDIVLTDKALEPAPAVRSPPVTISSEPKPAPAKPVVATPAPKPEAAKPPVATTPPAKPEATVVTPPAAPKPEASAPEAKPATKNDAMPATPAKPDATKAGAAKADAPKADPAKAETSKADPAKSDAAKADAAKADAAKAGASKADATKADAAKAEPAKSDAAAADDKNDPSKRGIFGRMLDKIGF